MKALLFLCCLVGITGFAAIAGLLGMGKFTIEWPSSDDHETATPADGHPAPRSTPARYEMCSPEIGTASLIPEGSATTYEMLGWCYGACPCPDVPVDPETVRKCRPGTYLGCDDGKPACWDRPLPNAQSTITSSVDLECFVSIPPGGVRTRHVRDTDAYAICHIPSGNPTNTQNLSLPLASVAAHLAQGDCVGACPCSGCLVFADPDWVACPSVTNRTDCLGPRCLSVTISANGPHVNKCSACPAPPTPKVNCTASCPQLPPVVDCAVSCPTTPGTNATSYNYTKCISTDHHYEDGEDDRRRRISRSYDDGDDDDDDDDDHAPAYCDDFRNICKLCPFNASQCPPPVVEPPNCPALGCAACAAEPACAFCNDAQYGASGTCLFAANATDQCLRVTGSIADVGQCFTEPPPPPVDCAADCPLNATSLNSTQCSDLCPNNGSTPVDCASLSCAACALSNECGFCFDAINGSTGVCVNLTDLAGASCIRQTEDDVAQCFVPPPPADCPLNITALNSTQCGLLCPFNTSSCADACPPPPTDCSTLGCSECAAAHDCVFCADETYGASGTCLPLANATDACLRTIATLADVGECYVPAPTNDTAGLNCSESCPPTPPPPVSCAALDCDACHRESACAFCFYEAFGATGACFNASDAPGVCARVAQDTPGACYVPAPSNCTLTPDLCELCPPPVVDCSSLECAACALEPQCSFCTDSEYGPSGQCMSASDAANATCTRSTAQPGDCFTQPPAPPCNTTEGCIPCNGTSGCLPCNSTSECPPVDCDTDCPVLPPVVDCGALDCVGCSLAVECAFCADSAYGPAGVCLNASDIGAASCARDVTTTSDCFVGPPPPTNCSECPVPPVDCALDCPIDPTNCTNAFNCSTLCPPTPVDCAALGCAECAIEPACVFCFDGDYGASGQCYATSDLPDDSCMRTAEISADECYRTQPVVCDNDTAVCDMVSSTNETFCAYLLPAVNCMQPSGPDFVVFWGYYLASPDPIDVPVGPDNMFELPTPMNLGQPTAFTHGSHSGVFTTLRAPGETQKWGLGYVGYGVQGSAVANDNTPLCPDCAILDDCGTCSSTVGCLWCDGSCVAGAGDVPIDELLVCNSTNDCGCANQTCATTESCGMCTLTPGCIWCNSSNTCVTSDSDDATACLFALDNMVQCPEVTLVFDPEDVENLREEVCCTDEPRGWVSLLVVLAVVGGLPLLLFILLLLVVLFTRSLRERKDD